MAEVDANQFREILSQIRHDLKTPVGHMLGYSEIIEEEFEDDPWPEFEEDLKHITHSAHTLVELIEDLLGASKKSLEEIDFVGTQYHLRQHLNHITGYCEMLHELAEDEKRSDLLPDLDRIIQASQTFTRIVDEKLRPVSFEDVESHSTHRQHLTDTVTKEDSAELQLTTNYLGEGGDLLVVDDNLTNCDLLERRLSRQGYNPTTVTSGKQALELLEHEQFDLILLDLLMPEINGIEVLQHLKANSRWRNIPVIVISALDDMEMIVKCVLLGAEDYIFKPFNPVLLKARIAANLEKVRLRRQQVPKLKIFISSPGDVIPERKIVRRLINELNEELADRVFLSPIFWEDEPLVASDTFQAQIYPARDSDIYIGIFWSRLGSPLPDNITRADGTRYLSGSEYEFEDAMSGFKSNGKPAILVYKKMSEPVVGLHHRELIMSRLEQNERLDEFVKNWFMTDDGKSYIGAFHGFEHAEEFEEMIGKHLRKLVLNQLDTLSI